MNESVEPTITLAKLYESQEQILDALIIYQKLNLQNSSLELEKKIDELKDKIFSNLQGNYTQLINSIFTPLDKQNFNILPHEDYISNTASAEDDEEELEDDFIFSDPAVEKEMPEIPEDENLEKIINETEADIEPEPPESPESDSESETSDLSVTPEEEVEPEEELKKAEEEAPPEDELEDRVEEDEDIESEGPPAEDEEITVDKTEAGPVEEIEIPEADTDEEPEITEPEEKEDPEEVTDHDETDDEVNAADPSEPDESDDLDHTKIDPNSIRDILNNIQDLDASEFESFLKSTFGPDRDLKEFKLSQIQKAIMLFKKEI